MDRLQIVQRILPLEVSGRPDTRQWYNMISLPRRVQSFAANPAFKVILHRGHSRHERRDPLTNVEYPQWGRGSRRRPHAAELRRALGVLRKPNVLTKSCAFKLSTTRTCLKRNGCVNQHRPQETHKVYIADGHEDVRMLPPTCGRKEHQGGCGKEGGPCHVPALRACSSRALPRRLVPRESHTRAARPVGPPPALQIHARHCAS